MRIRVLYIDGDGPFGGASRSLFEAVRALSVEAVEPYFIAAHGTAFDFYKLVAKDAINTHGLTKFDNTRYGFYRGLRWLVLLRELAYIPLSIVAVFRAYFRWEKVDLIHVNEFVYIFPALLAKILFRVPLVVHIRSVVESGHGLKRTKWLNRVLAKQAEVVIAIDENTRASIPPHMKVEVIHNSFTPKYMLESDLVFEEKLKKLRSSSLKVGFVGNLHHSKGIFDLLDAARILKSQKVDVEFLIVGWVTIPDTGLKAWLLSRAGLAQNVQRELENRIIQYDMNDYFHLLGGTKDIQRVYEGIDVIAFPSHYDAPGRPVFEAAFSYVPAIVAVNQPQADTLVHGETGLAIPARDPEQLAAAIRYFSENPEEVIRMGNNAKALAEENFEPLKNANQLLEIYKHLVFFGEKGAKSDITLASGGKNDDDL
ncbi:glycosyltransferase family 4 protein [Geothrix sp. 21YS21S-4]|uniref:glycosyltransferase family 4 protein n=1 Tax=Geothrix sp. 21YS21S-4 TaxID=3068889 RepID=UPI0027B9DE39|nr:glycosyltransferase family 4 protein [Geothrix sp. 21YS21S-4]